MKLNAQQIQAMAIAAYQMNFSDQRAAELASEVERHLSDVVRAAPALEIDDPIWAHEERMHRDGLSRTTPGVSEDE
jgi:hypothetical protein